MAALTLSRCRLHGSSLNYVTITSLLLLRHLQSFRPYCRRCTTHQSLSLSSPSRALIPSVLSIFSLKWRECDCSHFSKYTTHLWCAWVSVQIWMGWEGPTAELVSFTSHVTRFSVPHCASDRHQYTRIVWCVQPCIHSEVKLLFRQRLETTFQCYALSHITHTHTHPWYLLPNFTPEFILHFFTKLESKLDLIYVSIGRGVGKWGGNKLL